MVNNKKATHQLPTTDFFPENIKDDIFKNRRMTVHIFATKTFKETGEALKQKFLTLEQNFKKRNAKGAFDTLAKAAKIGGDEIRNIVIPVPNELNDSSTNDFETKEGIVSSVTGMIPGVNNIQENIVSRAAAQLGMQKKMANPGYFQNYTGTEPREFSFNFKFIPNSKKEAETIINIINVFKRYSSPSTNLGKTILTAPNFFAITFESEKLTNFLNIQPFVIKNISVNYATTGILETTLDGMPKFITMTLQIAEFRALTQEDW